MSDRPSDPGALSRGARGASPSQEGAFSGGARGASPSQEKNLSGGARGANPAHESTTTLTDQLPPIPPKRYFAIGEVSELCAVKPHVLRYWEREFKQLHPVKRRGNRRYYQPRDVIMVRRIRELLYDQGFTIDGARQRLTGKQGAEEQAQSRLVVRQMIAELEDLRRTLQD